MCHCLISGGGIRQTAGLFLLKTGIIKAPALVFFRAPKRLYSPSGLRSIFGAPDCVFVTGVAPKPRVSFMSSYRSDVNQGVMKHG